jgi:hypothetical protein
MQAQQIRYESLLDTRMSRMDFSGFNATSRPTRIQMNCTTTRVGNYLDTDCD